ncbi:hypothetical protein [Paenibacillus contaminans]|uniref:hypothetical protein n=1 Tax=Paenibacillus contaminans TaxID=450362 RepID=UPI0013145930|nr:hypothetical protein [Paenibacillus contaminans]
MERIRFTNRSDIQSERASGYGYETPRYRYAGSSRTDSVKPGLPAAAVERRTSGHKA